MNKFLAKKPKVIVIVGPTASGKTRLSIELAKKFDGEIISADSRQIYKGLDLGTGKVTKEEMDGIPHHMLDVSDPMNIYTSSDFVHDAKLVLDDILKRKKIPIIAGGTFFYIDNLLGKIQTPEVPPNKELRAKLEKMSTDALFTVLLQNDARRAEEIDPHNKRRLIRALEIIEVLGRVPKQKSEIKYDTFTVGIKTNRKQLHENIKIRIEDRLEEGMIEEVKKLHEGGMTYERMEDLGLEYRYISRLLQKKLTKEKTIKELNAKTRQFAKRQLSWLNRNKEIHWHTNTDRRNIVKEIEKFLTNYD